MSIVTVMVVYIIGLIRDIYLVQCVVEMLKTLYIKMRLIMSLK